MVFLQHIANAGAAACERLSIHKNGSLLRAEQSADQIQQSGFASPGGPYNCQELLGHQIKGYMRKGSGLPGKTMVRKADILYFQKRIHIETSIFL